LGRRVVYRRLFVKRVDRSIRALRIIFGRDADGGSTVPALESLAAVLGVNAEPLSALAYGLNAHAMSTPIFV